MTVGVGHADEAERIDKEQVVKIMLVCALHSQDTALDAPWASGESSAAAMSVLIELAHSMECPDAGAFLGQFLSRVRLNEKRCTPASTCMQVRCKEMAAHMTMLAYVCI